MRSSKGQLSVDMFFAMLYIVVLITALTTIAHNYIENQRIIAIRFQERRIAMQVAKIINYASTLKNGEFTVTYDIPKIYILGKTVPMKCNIDIGNEDINVIVTYEGSIIYSTIPFVKPNGITINNGGPVKCGEPLTIENI